MAKTQDKSMNSQAYTINCFLIQSKGPVVTITLEYGEREENSWLIWTS